MAANEMKCERCGEELTAPAWSGNVEPCEIHNIWQCTKCGYIFKSVDPRTPLPLELAKQFLPNLVME